MQRQQIPVQNTVQAGVRSSTRVTVKGHHVEVTDEMRRHAEESLAKWIDLATECFDRTPIVTVTYTVEGKGKTSRQSAHVTFGVGDQHLRANESNGNCYHAMTLAAKAIGRQIGDARSIQFQKARAGKRSQLH